MWDLLKSIVLREFKFCSEPTLISLNQLYVCISTVYANHYVSNGDITRR